MLNPPVGGATKQSESAAASQPLLANKNSTTSYGAGGGFGHGAAEGQRVVNGGDLQHADSRQFNTSNNCQNQIEHKTQQTPTNPANHHYLYYFRSLKPLFSNNNSTDNHQAELYYSKRKEPSKASKMAKWLQYLGLLFVGLILLACIHLLWFRPGQLELVTRLRMVSVISRHGDRAPSDGFQWNDAHQSKIQSYWPNGLSNLTELGRYREFKLGLRLRQLYKNYLTFDSSEILALSSPIKRCVVSIGETLRGMYNMELDGHINRHLLRRERSCVLEHSGNVSACGLSKSAFLQSGVELWKQIEISTSIVPTLTWEYLSKCPWRLKNPSAFDADSQLDPNIARLPGIKKLEKTLIDNYKVHNLNYTMTAIFGTIFAELNIERTEENFNDTSHFIDWIETPAGEDHNSNNHKLPPTLYDLIEEASLVLYKDRINGRAALIQLGPILTSLVDSFSVALDRPQDVYNLDNLKHYKNKKMVYYSTHDTIIVNLMESLKMIDFETAYEARFKKYSHASDTEQFLNGLRMPAFGASLRFELYEMETGLNKTGSGDSQESFAYLQAFLYNEHEIRSEDINYVQLELGKACASLFAKLHPEAKVSDFYQDKFPFDKALGCPLELFRSLTSEYLMSGAKLQKLCNEL